MGAASRPSLAATICVASKHGWKARRLASAMIGLTGVHHAAAEHDALDVQQVDDGGDARTDESASSLDHHGREIVALACFVGYVLGSEVFVDRQT